MARCQQPETTWHKVAELDELPEGRVKTVTVGLSTPRARPEAHDERRLGRDHGQLGSHTRVRHGRPLQPRFCRRDAGGGEPTPTSASVTKERRRSPPAPTASSPAAWPHVSGSPILAISGQVASSVKGRGAFQDLDLEAAFSDVAAYSHTVQAGSDAAELMSLACKTAIVDRKVGHLMLPDEVQKIPSDAAAAGPEGRMGLRESPPPEEALEAALKRIAESRKPLFTVDAGARHDMEEIIRCAESMGAPVVTTFKAKGQIADSHPLGCGVLGRSGTPIASWLMNESDLLVVFGASFSNHTGIAEYKAIVQVDYDPMALGRFHPVEVPVLGHVGVTARLLAERMPADHNFQDRTEEVAHRWEIWRNEKASRRQDMTEEGINSEAIFESMTRLVDPDAVVAVDVGNNTYSFGRYFETERQSIVMSGYLGSIGFAFPAAMGLWAAVGDSRQVIAVAGDGGFGQYAMEFTTAVKADMNITLILLVNDELGKISKEQRGEGYDVWQTGLVTPDFASSPGSAVASGSGWINVTTWTTPSAPPSTPGARPSSTSTPTRCWFDPFCAYSREPPSREYAQNGLADGFRASPRAGTLSPRHIQQHTPRRDPS